MTSAEHREYAVKSGLTAEVVRTAVTDGQTRLLVHQNIYPYAKDVCRMVFGDTFAERVRVVIDTGRQISDKYGWQIGVAGPP